MKRLTTAPPKDVGRFSVERVCKQLSVSRQAYYKWSKKKEREEIDNKLIISLVGKIRKKKMPRVGGKKVHYILQKKHPEAIAGVGRDKFFRILRGANLLIHPRKKFHGTTNSHHWLKKWTNLIKGKIVTKAYEVLVSDITYIDTEEGFCFLALVTDLYSRKILGYDVSTELTAAGCLRALKMALKHLPKGMKYIHHSDRGVQYCSKPYVTAVKKAGGEMSMTDDGNVYENAVAERVNGILKGEFYLDIRFENVAKAKRAIRETIAVYNNDRPHDSLKKLTPSEAFELSRKAG